MTSTEPALSGSGRPAWKTRRRACSPTWSVSAEHMEQDGSAAPIKWRGRSSFSSADRRLWRPGRATSPATEFWRCSISAGQGAAFAIRDPDRVSRAVGLGRWRADRISHRPQSATCTMQGMVAYGHCINVAARLQAMADPSSILFTSALRTAVGRLPRDFLAFDRPTTLEEHFRSRSKYSRSSLGREHSRARLARDRRERLPDVEPVRHPTIAVLALTNLSGDPATIIFARASPRTSSPVSPGSATSS